MNLPLRGTVFCVGKKQDEMKDKTKFYSIAVATAEGDAGNISCTEEVYLSVEPMNQYIIECIYRDGQYKGLRVTGALDARHAEDELKKKLSEEPPAGEPSRKQPGKKQ